MTTTVPDPGDQSVTEEKAGAGSRIDKETYTEGIVPKLPAGGPGSLWRRFLRYLVSGGLAFVVDYATFFIMTSLVHSRMALSQGTARLTGAVAGYFLQRHFVFHTEKTGLAAFRQGLGYSILTVLNIGLSAALAGFFGSLSGSLPAIVPKVATDSVMVAETFALLHLVFRREGHA